MAALISVLLALSDPTTDIPRASARARPVPDKLRDNTRLEELGMRRSALGSIVMSWILEREFCTDPDRQPWRWSLIVPTRRS